MMMNLSSMAVVLLSIAGSASATYDECKHNTGEGTCEADPDNDCTWVVWSDGGTPSCKHCPGNDNWYWCENTFGEMWKPRDHRDCFDTVDDCECKDGWTKIAGQCQKHEGCDEGDFNVGGECKHCPGNNDPMWWCMKEEHGWGGNLVWNKKWPLLGNGMPESDGCYDNFDDCFCEPNAVECCGKCVTHCDEVCPPGSYGDPHFRTWHGLSEFEYHGECDLVLLKSKSLDMAIYIRTTIRFDYSFISEAAVRVGEDVFEVASWGEYMLNDMNTIDMPVRMGDYFITMEKINKKKTVFSIHLDSEMDVNIISMKDYVSVKIENGTDTLFHDAEGLMGDYVTGHIATRDGSVLNMDVSQPNVIGQEWQVQPEIDGQLFSDARYPQYPAKCELPPTWAVQTLGRKLGEASISQTEAEVACAHASEHMRSNCIKDVMKTQDVEMAEIY